MTDTKPIRRIAIIGSGVIGASWTALFLGGPGFGFEHAIGPRKAALARLIER
jgi:glycine/D-amino acid oxidase-like deaminating enzyme